MRLLIAFAMMMGTAAAQASLIETVIETDSNVQFVSFTRDSAALIVGKESGIQFLDADSGDPVESEVVRIEGQEGIPPGFALLRVGSLPSGEALAQNPSGGVVRPRAAAFSPDGRLWANSNVPAREMTVLETDSGRVRFTFPAGLGAVYEVKFSPDGRLLAASYGDTEIRVWDVVDGRLVHVIDELNLLTASMKFSADGALLITGGVDETVRVWDTRTWNQLRQFETRHPESIQDLHMSADGRYVLTVGFDATTVLNPAHLVLWDMEGGEEVARIRLPQAPSSASLAPDGKKIAVAEGDQPRIRLWTVGD